MFHIIIYASLLTTTAYGHAKYMVCSTPVVPNPTAAPLSAPSAKYYSWNFPTLLFANETRARFYSKISPGMAVYSMNVPATSTPANLFMAKGYYNDSLTITAVKSNGVKLTQNYSFYKPNEALTITLGDKWQWLGFAKAEAILAVNETGVTGVGAQLIGNSFGYPYGCSTDKKRYYLCGQSASSSCSNPGPTNVTLQMPSSGIIKIMSGWAVSKASLSWAPSLILIPETVAPSFAPSVPTVDPSFAPSAPTFSPSFAPSAPTSDPTFAPSNTPSVIPSVAPSTPTSNPSFNPSKTPSVVPSAPTFNPSFTPSKTPSIAPSSPTKIPSFVPSKSPSYSPSLFIYPDISKDSDNSILAGIIVGSIGGFVILFVVLLYFYSIMIPKKNESPLLVNADGN